MVENDVINRLLEREHRAFEILLESQGEASRRITRAHTQAEETFRQQCDALAVSLDSDFKAAQENLRSEKERHSVEYRARLESLQGDRASFNALLDSLFFEGQRG
jgi:vacuolar-type H+-ATPase subunit H